MTQPMFDCTKKAEELFDPETIAAQVARMEGDEEGTERLMKGIIADQNKVGIPGKPFGSKIKKAPMAVGSCVATINLEMTELVTPEEFEQIMGAIMQLPVARKLKYYDGVPSIETTSNGRSFSEEEINANPILKEFDFEFVQCNQIRISEKPQPVPEPDHENPNG